MLFLQHWWVKWYFSTAPNCLLGVMAEMATHCSRFCECAPTVCVCAHMLLGRGASGTQAHFTVPNSATRGHQLASGSLGHFKTTKPRQMNKDSVWQLEGYCARHCLNYRDYTSQKNWTLLQMDSYPIFIFCLGHSVSFCLPGWTLLEVDLHTWTVLSQTPAWAGLLPGSKLVSFWSSKTSITHILVGDWRFGQLESPLHVTVS